MANEFIEYHHSAPCLWKWPMQVGILNPPDDIAQHGFHTHWAKRFCTLQPLEASTTPLNLLYLVSADEEDIEKMMSIHIQADILILHVSSSLWDTDKKHKSILQQAKKLAIHAKCFSVLYVQHNLDLHEWFNQFTISLCHNQTIHEALTSCCQHVVGLYDPVLDEKATLSFLFRKTLSILSTESHKFEGKFSFHTKLVPTAPMTVDDLLSLLTDRNYSAQYNHESDEATGLAELFQTLHENIGLNILQETERFQHAAPPQTGGEEDSNADDESETIPQPSPAPSPSIEELLEKIDNYVPSSGTRGGGSFMPIEDVFEITGRGTAVSNEHKMGSLATSEKSKPRFLQSAFRDMNDKMADALLVANSYKVVVRIGEFNRKWTQSLQDSFPTDTLFTDPSIQQEKIQLHFSTNLTSTAQFAEVVLNRQGDSNEAVFMMACGPNPLQFEAHILAYHKNRLLQRAILTAPIIALGDDPDTYPAPELQIDRSLVSELSNLDERIPFVFSLGGDVQSGVITGIANNQAIELPHSAAIQQQMLKIKQRIQQAAIDTENFPEDLYAEENQTLLLRLALDGNDLYVHYLQQKSHFDGPIQLISRDGEFLPIDFVYTYAAPSPDAMVCEHAAEALLKGSCCGCPEIQQSPCKLICPFGFLGFRQIIEHHSVQEDTNDQSSSYKIVSEPGQQRRALPILRNTLYASSQKVVSVVPSLTDEIHTAFQTHTQHSSEALNWKEWETKIEAEKPDSLFLIVHIEKGQRSDHNELEIGDKNFLVANLLNERILKSSQSSQFPIVVLIGCEAIDLEFYGLDIGSRLIQLGVPMVISNFTKIRGRHAGPLVVKLLEFLKSHEGEEIKLGEIILKLRQYLLAKGIMVGLALTTLGDADWKIKL